MRIAAGLRDFLFRCRHGFRGVPVQVGGHCLRVDESLRRWDFAAEAEVQSAFQKTIRPGNVVLDIGANFGQHTLLAAQLIGPEGHVFAFEPIQDNLRLLRRNIELNGFADRVRVIPSAVSDSPEAQLRFSVPASGLSVTAAVATRATEATARLVPNLRLDDCADLRRPVNFIKIDVEGAELSVLQGARKLLTTDRPVVLVEVHVFAFESMGTNLERWHQAIAAFGYRETALTPRTYGGADCYHALLTPDLPETHAGSATVQDSFQAPYVPGPK